jgi:hypothetical protein
MPEASQVGPLAEPEPATSEGDVCAGTEEGERPPERQYCVFRAGGRRFCLAILDVEEIVVWPAITSLPLAPPFLLGICNLRGTIVPVMDITVAEEPALSLAKGRLPDQDGPGKPVVGAPGWRKPRQVIVARWASENGRADARLGLAADEVLGTYTTTKPLLADEAVSGAAYGCGRLPCWEDPEMTAGATFPAGLPLALDVKRLAAAFPVPAI